VQLTITINTDNDAFGRSKSQIASEVGRILVNLTTNLREDPAMLNYSDVTSLRDINGNTVGQVTYKEEA
jgi:hypothetical protein